MVSGSIGASEDAMSSVAAATSDIPGAITRNVPSSVANALDNNTRSPGSRTPNAEIIATRSCMTLGSTVPLARTWSANSRAMARSSRSGATCSLTSATRSMLSLSNATSR